MECLPNLEVLSFLNWIDVNGYAGNSIDTPLELLFLDSEYSNQVLTLEHDYYNNYYSTQTKPQESSFEKILEFIIQDAKAEIMREYQLHPYRFESSYYQKIDTERILDSIRDYCCSVKHNTGEPYNDLNTSPIHYYWNGLLTDSVRAYLNYNISPSVKRYFYNSNHSLVSIAFKFVKWLQKRYSKSSYIGSIPVNIMRDYIKHYVWEEYRSEGFSKKSAEKLEELLCRIMIKREYGDYLSSQLTSNDYIDYFTDTVVKRCFNRATRYKCTLLADDNSFCTLVHQYWKDLNEYSGEHLDIYYSEAELTQKGYTTADKLHIRENVSEYPAIYLWEYALNEGISIHVDGLNAYDLFDLFKIIVDEIVSNHSLLDIADTANNAVKSLILSKNLQKEKEEKLNQYLIKACADLQGNESWVRNTNENGRNTYLRDMLRAYGYAVSDQTLGGISPTGLSAGEIDLKIADEKGLPFAIVEALNIKTSITNPHQWNRKYFINHVDKLYGYDSNGLQRNYIIVYAETPEFDIFTSEVLQLVSNPKKCKYGDATFVSIESVETSYSDLSLSRAKYIRNKKEVQLYILCVRIAAAVTSQ